MKYAKWISILMAVMACAWSVSHAQLDYERLEFEGRPYLAYFPDEPPVALVFVFHGSTGSADFIQRDGNIAIMEAMAKSGYAMVSPQSLERHDPESGVLGKWKHDYPGKKANPDLTYLFDFYDMLVEEGKVDAETPIFTHGMSNGGGMSSFFGLAAAAKGLPVIAIANYMGPIPQGAGAFVEKDGGPIPPLFLVIAGNDGLVKPEWQYLGVEWLRERGGLVEVHEIPERPLSVEALIARGTSPEEAARMMEVLMAEGIIDSEGKRLLNAGGTIGRKENPTLLKAFDKGDFSREAKQAVKQVWSVHQMRDDLAADQMAFFGSARLGAYKTVQPGSTIE